MTDPPEATHCRKESSSTMESNSGGTGPCWEIQPKFCARRANGRLRCRKGTCWLVEP